MGRVSVEPGRSRERNGDCPEITSHPQEIGTMCAGFKCSPRRKEQQSTLPRCCRFKAPFAEISFDMCGCSKESFRMPLRGCFVHSSTASRCR
jgi:hypothetical protein